MSVHDTNSIPEIASSDYQSLAELRYQIRRFLRFSEQAARRAGLEPAQHQFLLAIKGLPEDQRPTVGVLAERLQIRPHSAVELLNRLVKRGFVRRQRNDQTNTNLTDRDRRHVLLKLTAKAENLLRELSLHHRQELQNAGPALMTALEALLGAPSLRRTESANSHRHTENRNQRKGAMHVTIR